MNSDFIIIMATHGLVAIIYYHSLFKYLKYRQSNLFLQKFTKYIKYPETYFDTSIQNTFILQTILLITIGLIPFLNFGGIIYLQNNTQELKNYSKKTIKYLNRISPFRKILFKRIFPLTELYSLDVKIKKILLDYNIELIYFNEIYTYTQEFQAKVEIVYECLYNDYFKLLKNIKDSKIRYRISTELELLDTLEKNFRKKIYFLNNDIHTKVPKLIYDEIYRRIGLDSLFRDIRNLLEISDYGVFEIQRDLIENINLIKREKL